MTLRIVGSPPSPYVRKVLVFLWRLFNQVAITPAVCGEQGDSSLVARTLETDVPQVLDYLERELPDDGFLFDGLSIADISIASFVERVLATPPFKKLAKLEDRLIRTAIQQHRQVLKDLGVRLSDDTLFVATPRLGVMAI